MFLTQRIALECSRFVRQLSIINTLVAQSFVVIYGGECVTSCHNMASSHHGTESDVAERKDNIRKSPENEDCQTSAKRLKISDSSLENAVGVIGNKFIITVSWITVASTLQGD